MAPLGGAAPPAAAPLRPPVSARRLQRALSLDEDYEALGSRRHRRRAGSAGSTGSGAESQGEADGPGSEQQGEADGASLFTGYSCEPGSKALNAVLVVPGEGCTSALPHQLYGSLGQPHSRTVAAVCSSPCAHLSPDPPARRPNPTQPNQLQCRTSAWMCLLSRTARWRWMLPPGATTQVRVGCTRWGWAAPGGSGDAWRWRRGAPAGLPALLQVEPSHAPA